jgi:hypothetical protein
MVSIALKLAILQAVAGHQGEWYWYQLDRRLVGTIPEVPERLMAAVKELAAAGLIDIRLNPVLGDIPRYWLTDAGQAWMKEHGPSA